MKRMLLVQTIAIRAAAAAVVAAVTLGAGAPETPSPQTLAQAQQSAPAKLFHGVGIVTAIEPASGALTINHEAIQGMMPAMEMTFRVAPRTLSKGVRPGDEVEFGVDGKRYTILELKVVGHTQ